MDGASRRVFVFWKQRTLVLKNTIISICLISQIQLSHCFYPFFFGINLFLSENKMYTIHIWVNLSLHGIFFVNYIYKGEGYPVAWLRRHGGGGGWWKYSSNPLTTLALQGCEWSAPRPGHFTLGKTQYPLSRREGGPWFMSGWAWKISSPPAFDPRIVKSVVSYYTNLLSWSLKYIHTTLKNLSNKDMDLNCDLSCHVPLYYVQPFLRKSVKCNLCLLQTRGYIQLIWAKIKFAWHFWQ